MSKDLSIVSCRCRLSVQAIDLSSALLSLFLPPQVSRLRVHPRPRSTARTMEMVQLMSHTGLPHQESMLYIFSVTMMISHKHHTWHRSNLPPTHLMPPRYIAEYIVVGQNVLMKIDTQVKISIVLVLHQRQS